MSTGLSLTVIKLTEYTAMPDPDKSASRSYPAHTAYHGSSKEENKVDTHRAPEARKTYTIHTNTRENCSAPLDSESGKRAGSP